MSSNGPRFVFWWLPSGVSSFTPPAPPIPPVYDIFWPGLGAMRGIDWPGLSVPIDWPGITP